MITCCNLLSGATAVVLAFEGHFTLALCSILLGATFDFFDGFTARLLHVSSPIGKELDSLADCITFGLAPSIMLMQAIRLETAVSNYDWGYWSLVCLLMAAFSALRLAKFNCDERQTTSFIGLATPANAIFWASLIADMPKLASYFEWMPFVMVTIMLISCYMLISEVPMFSLKFHNLSWEENKVRFLFLIGAVLSIIMCLLAGHILLSGTIIILWYIGLSLFTKA